MSVWGNLKRAEPRAVPGKEIRVVLCVWYILYITTRYPAKRLVTCIRPSRMSRRTFKKETELNSKCWCQIMFRCEQCISVIQRANALGFNCDSRWLALDTTIVEWKQLGREGEKKHHHLQWFQSSHAILWLQRMIIHYSSFAQEICHVIAPFN